MNKEKTSPKKEKPVKGSGEPLTHKEESQVKQEEKKEEAKEETRFVLQYNKTTDEDNYETLRKQGKVYVTTDKTKAEEIAERIMQKHPEIAATRICRISNGVLIPVTEFTGKDIIEKSKNVLPEEFRGIVSEDMLQYMDEQELQNIRGLITEFIRKREQITQLSRIAVQRSAFRRDKTKVKALESLKEEYRKAKEEYTRAKEQWEETREKIETFISEEEKRLPSIGAWLRGEIMGVRTVRRTSGRVRAPGGKRELILKFLQEHKGEKFKEREIREKLSQLHQDYSWSQQSTWAAIKSLREEGIINRDSEGRYFIP